MAISTFTPGGNEVDTNGATHVTVVAAPAAGTQRIVSSVKIHNGDTATVDAQIIISTGGTRRILARNSSLVIDGTLEVRDIVLDATNKLIEVVLGGAHDTVAPVAQAAYVDKA